MYLPLDGFPVRRLGSNDPVPKKVQSGVRSRQWLNRNPRNGKILGNIKNV